MATKTTTTSSERGHRKVKDQPNAFIGLYLAPLAALPFSWLIHLWAFGLSLGPIDFHPNQALQTGTMLLLGAAVVGLTVYAHSLAGHRDAPIRWAFTITVAVLGVLFGWNVGTGPQYVISGAFLILAWIAATAHAFPRLNVARKDAKGDGEEKEGAWERMGLGRFRPKVREQVYDKDGNLERTELHVKHPGETVEPLQNAVRNMESLAGAPSGLSHATGTERADESTVTILHRDPLKGRVPYGPPSHPGGSIQDPIIFGVYKNGQPTRIYLAGGPAAINPTGYIFMGASRTGKTQAENLMLTDLGSRRDWCVLYLNRAKGRQDVRPVLPVIEAAILSDADADYKNAYRRIKKAMTYRSKVLGEYGISAWSPSCYSNPPKRKANGDPIPMEPLPFLLVHAGEADDILDAADEDTIYVASKGLSLGIATGWSLQRALGDSMPMGLKENLGLRLCFGTGNWNAAAFVMDESTIKAVDPSEWGQKYPGRHLLQGPGIDESQQPVYAKTMGLAPGMEQDAPVEEHNAAMSAEMLRRNHANAPHMAKLDRGTAMATGMVGPVCWWDSLVAETAKLRRQLGVDTASSTANPTASSTASSAPDPTANMTASDRNFPTATPEPYPTANQEDDVRFQTTAIPDDAEDLETTEVRAEMDDLDEYDGLPLFPRDEDDSTAEGLTLDDLPRAPAGHSLTWDDPLPTPASRAEAIAGLRAALVELFNGLPAELADPDDPDAVLLQTNHIFSRYKFRKRPFFSAALASMANGELDPPEGFTLTVAEEYPSHDRHFRLRRVISDDEHGQVSGP